MGVNLWIRGSTSTLDGSHLALEFEGTLDVLQHDGARTSARDPDGAIVEEPAAQSLLDQDALDLADNNLMGVAMNPAMAVEKPLVAHKDGGRQVADEATQVKVGDFTQFGLIDDGFTRGDNFFDFHNLSYNWR